MWCPKDLRVRAPAALVLTYSVSIKNLWHNWWDRRWTISTARSQIEYFWLRYMYMWAVSCGNKGCRVFKREYTIRNILGVHFKFLTFFDNIHFEIIFLLKMILNFWQLVTNSQNSKIILGYVDSSAKMFLIFTPFLILNNPYYHTVSAWWTAKSRH